MNKTIAAALLALALIPASAPAQEGGSLTINETNDPMPPVAETPQQPAVAPQTPDDGEGAGEDAAPQPQNYGAIRLQGLDKVTARRERFDATMGAVTRFGNLEVIPHACWKAPDSDRPETAGLLEVWYWKPGEKPAQIFYGWMFASSPALSSLEHPVYDLTVLECLDEAKDEAAAEEEKAAPKKKAQ